jgi:hypothetical protein
MTVASTKSAFFWNGMQSGLQAGQYSKLLGVSSQKTRLKLF